MCSGSNAVGNTVGLTAQIAVPPRYLQNIDAGTLQSALAESEVAPVARLVNCCEQLVQIYETDSASSNLKLIRWLAKRQTKLPSHAIVLHMPCLVHLTHLVSGSALMTLDGRAPLGFVSNLYSFCLLLRTPGYFQRVLSAVSSVVRQRLARRPWPPPAGSHPSPSQLPGIDIFMLAGAKLDATGLPSDPKVQEFCRFFNGHWHEEAVVHHCPGPACCASRASCEARATALIEDVVSPLAQWLSTQLLVWLLFTVTKQHAVCRGATQLPLPRYLQDHRQCLCHQGGQKWKQHFSGALSVFWHMGFCRNVSWLLSAMVVPVD